MMLRNAYAILFFFTFGMSACSTVPEEVNPAKAALLAEPPAEYSSAIELGFRKRVTFVKDGEINQYLSRIAGRLFNPGKYPIHIEIVNAQSAGFEPSVWVVPGGKVFIDLRVLKQMRFENEIAAALALGWDRSEGIPFRERMIQEVGKAEPDPAKIWIFSDSENQKAIEASIERIYKAGYDPRGLVSYFDHLSSEQNLLKDKARRTISVYAPLLNPIVRTEEFYKMRKRLNRL